MENHKYDLAFVGSGIACSYTIINWVKLIEKCPLNEKITLVVIDKAEEFWCGIPYGSRSGFNSLMITSLKEFLPIEELDLLKTWLKRNIEWALRNFKKNGGILSSNWFAENQHLIKRNIWDEIYLPRYIFGYYMRDRMSKLLENAKAKNQLDYFLLKSEVIEIEKTNPTYKLKVKDDLQGLKIIETERVILSIGSPPINITNSLKTDRRPPQMCLVEDLYKPKLEENLNIIVKELENSPEKDLNNILLIGSNASAIEAVYNIMDFPGLSNLINKVYCFSRTGEFPNRINNYNYISDDYTPITLNNLKLKAHITSQQILDAVKKDIEIAKKNKISIADFVCNISTIINELLFKLNTGEQELFVNKYGVEIGKFQRRAGKAYRDNIDDLMFKNKLQILKGEFIRFSFENGKSSRIEYKDIVSSETKSISTVIKCVINCSGFEPLDLDSSSALIRTLISNNICTANDSKRGFIVDENFESNKNFFIIGPLLAGNVNKSMMVWHAESCSRIYFLSKTLAESLKRSFEIHKEFPQKRSEASSAAKIC